MGLAAKLTGLLLVAIVTFFPTAEGIGESVSHSHARLQVSSASVNPVLRAGIIRFAEAMEEIPRILGYQILQLCRLFGIGLVI